MIRIRIRSRKKNHSGSTTLKARMPELANTSVRRIQEVCHDDLKLPSRRVAEKPPRRLELVRKQKKGKT
jgi:hypothetical protein